MRWLRGDRLNEAVRFRMLSTCVFLPQACVKKVGDMCSLPGMCVRHVCSASRNSIITAHSAVHGLLDGDEALAKASDDHVNGWQMELSVWQTNHEKIWVGSTAQIKAERIRYRRAADVCRGQMVVDLNLARSSRWLWFAVPPALAG
jgi:hypothetical protein